MKNHNPTPCRSMLAVAAIALITTSGSSAWAATGTWTGSTDSTWAGGNWSVTPAPGATSGTVNTDTAVFNSATPASGNGLAGSPVVIDSGRDIGSITFDTNAAAYVIGTGTGGNTLNLTGGGTIQDASTMTSGNIETVNAPLVLNGNYTFANNSTNAASALQIGGTVTGAANAAVTLTLSGANTSANNIVSAVLSPGSGSGSLAITKTGAGFWDITGNNTGYTGTTTISGGVLDIGNSNALGSGLISIGSGGALAADTAVSLTNNFALPGGASNSAYVTGSHSISTSGNLVISSTTGTPTVFFNNLTGGATFTVTGNTFLANNTSNIGELILGGSGNTSLNTIYGGPMGSTGIGSLLYSYGTGTLTLNGPLVATGAEDYLGGTVIANENGSGAGSLLGGGTNGVTLGTNLVLSGGSGNVETVNGLGVAGNTTLSYVASITATPGSGNTINIGGLGGGAGVSQINFQPGVAYTTSVTGASAAYNTGFSGIFGPYALAGNGVNSEDFATNFGNASNAITGLPTYLYSNFGRNTSFSELIANAGGVSGADTGDGNFLQIKIDATNSTSAGSYAFSRTNALFNLEDGGSGSILYTGFANYTINGNAMIGSYGTSSFASGITYLDQYGTGTLTINNNIYGADYFLNGTSQPNGNVTEVYNTGHSGNSGAIVKTGPGTVVLNGTNNYVGNTYIDGGVLSISSDSNLGGVTGSLTVTTGGTGVTTVLVTGIPISQILVGASFLGSTITTQSVSSTPGVAGGTSTLTLASAVTAATGTYAYANGQQNVELNGGTLQATSSFVLGEATSASTGTVSNYRSFTLGVNGGTIDVTGTNTLILPGVISQTTGGTGQLGGDAGVASFTKTDSGTLTLAGASTYLGGTYVNGGTLKLDFGATGISNFTPTANNILASGGALTLGGGTLNVNSASTAVTNTQTLASLALSGGANAITMTSNGSSTGEKLIFTNGAISRAAGSTIDFVSPTNTSITLTGNNNNGFLGTYAFLGTGSGETYAATNGSGTVVAAASTAITTASSISSGTANYAYTGAGGTDSSIVANSAANSIINNTATAQTIALGTNTLTVNGLLNAGGALTISGGTVATGSTNELVIGGGSSVSIASGITGGALTDSDSGTLTLSGVNTYTGPTTVNSGALVISGGSITGSSIVTAGSAVVSESAGAVIGGGSSFTQASTGTSALTGTNTYSGLTTVSAGELDLNNTGGQAVAGNVTVGGGVLKLLAANQIASTGSLAVSGGVFNIGTFNQTLAGLQLTGGTLSGTTGAITNNTAAYDIEAGVDSAILAGSAGLTKSTNGVALITAANTYTGSTTIATGELITSSIVGATSSNLGNASSAVGLGAASTTGTLDYTGTATNFTRGFAIGAAGGEVDNGATGLLTISSGSITGSSGTLTFGGVGSIAVSSNIVTGSGGLTAALDGTLTLSGSNSYTGATTINAGTLSASNIGSGGNLGTATSAININDGADFSYTGTSTTFTRGFTIGLAGGEIDSTSTTATLTIGTGNIVSNLAGLTTFGGAGNTLVQSAITSSTGTAGVTKIGTGTVTLAGLNTYTGTTTVSAGVLSVSNVVVSSGASNIGNATSAVVLGGGDFSYTGNTATYTRGFTETASSEIDSTAVGQTLNISTANITGNTFTTTFGGAGNTTVNSIIGTTTGGVIKNGTGTLTLANVNTYTGTTTVNNGLLYIASGGSTSTGTIVVANGGSLGGLGTVNSQVTLNSGGTINLGDGTIGTLHIGSLTTTGGGSFDFEIGGSTTATDLLADAAGFTASGTSTITIGNLGGTGQSLAAGTYNLITSTTALTLGNFKFTNSTNTMTLDGSTLTLLVNGDNLQVNVSASTTADGVFTSPLAPLKIIAGATTTVSGTLTNTASSGSNALNVSLTNDGNATTGTVTSFSSANPTTIAAASNSIVSGTFTAGSVGTGTYGFTNTDASAAPTTASVTGSVTVYNHAAGTLALTGSTTLKAIAGYAGTSSLTLTNSGANNDNLIGQSSGSSNLLAAYTGTLAGNGSTALTGTFTVGAAGTTATNTFTQAWQEESDVIGATTGVQTSTATVQVTSYNHAAGTLALNGSPSAVKAITGYAGTSSLTLTNNGANNDNLIAQSAGSNNLVAAYTGTLVGNASTALTGSYTAGSAGTTVTDTFTQAWQEENDVLGATTGVQTSNATVQVTSYNHAVGVLALSGSPSAISAITGYAGTSSLTLTNNGANNDNLIAQAAGSSNLLAASTATLSGNASTALTGTFSVGTAGTTVTDTFTQAYQEESDVLGATAGTQTSNATVTVTSYSHSAANLSSTSVNLGFLHTGTTVGTESTTLTNSGGSTAAGLQITSLTPGLTGGSVGDVIAASSSGETLSVNVGTVTTGSLNQSYTVGTSDQQTVLGWASNAPQTYTITGLVYSGVGSWTTAGGGSWGKLGGTGSQTFGQNWSTLGGSPGLDPNFKQSDSATFGTNVTGTAVVTLDGSSPSLNAITFNNTSGSYNIAQGSGGAVHLDSAGTATVTVSTGNDTISAPVVLDSNAATSVASSSTLTISGNITDPGESMTINGPGTTVLSGSNSYTGGTTVNSGATLLVSNGTNGSATGSGSFTLAAGATLGGVGQINASQFNLGVASPASQANVIVGSGTDATSQLTLTGSTVASNNVTNVQLAFNISATSPGQANVLNVGSSQITFSNTTLALNVQGLAWIGAYTPYMLIQGTAAGQYLGLTTTMETLGGVQYSVITDPSALQLAWSQSYANSAYGPNSVLILNTSNGADDIEVLVVPEPSTWAMILGGLAMLVFYQKRRSKSDRNF